MAYLIQIEFKIEIPDEEIGFLAIYFGSVIINSIDYSNTYDIICVCPKYNDLREQIEMQIVSMFNKRINIVKYVSSYSQISGNDKYDFIVSVISNSYTFKNIVYVSPVIGPWEYQKINAMIIECEKRRQKEEIKSLILKYFQPDLFFYNEPYLEDMEIMHFLHKKMKEKGIVEDDFLNYVLKREELASTAFFNKFAIPHAINANAKETKVAYYYSSKPINWFGSEVNLVLLMATKQYDQKFIRLYELIFEILMNKELYFKLLKCSSYEKMVDFISNQL
jgi:mannitol/fructose-specific phosphotransferase system IIA component (Ntr-type)